MIIIIICTVRTLHVTSGLGGQVRFVCAKAEDAIADLIDSTGTSASSGPPPSVVAVVDPPRTGLHPAVCAALSACLAVRRVVFVSCNPAAKFKRWDYVVRGGSLYDNAAVLCG